MADYVDAGVPFYRGKEVIERAKGNKVSTELFIHPTQFENIKSKFGSPKPGDILLTSVGTLGVPLYISENVDFYFKDGNLTWLRNFKQGVNPKFIYYWLISPKTQQKLDEISIGSTQRALTIIALKSLKIELPPERAQAAIVEALDALTNRITLLRETNRILEAIAQAIFKSWFLDFDPVRAKMEGRQPEGMDEATAALFPDSFEESELGLVPKGWTTQSVANVIDTAGGATPDTKNTLLWEPPEFHWTTPKDLSSALSPVLLNTERLISAAGLQKISSGLLPVGTLLMSSRAPIGYLTLTHIPVAINQGYIAMPPGGILPPIFMYFWCKTHMDVIKGYANGSTFMEISKKAFRPIPITVPSKPIVETFAEIASCLFDRISENTVQVTTLCTVRDGLLPRLISGQLRLPEAQEQIENALT